MNTEVLNNILVIKRNGRRVVFDGKKIAIAIKKAFDNFDNKYQESDINSVYNNVLEKIVNRYNDVKVDGKKIKIEAIQDLVEKSLFELGYLEIEQRYKEVRERKRKLREVHDERKKYKFLGMIEGIEELKDEDTLFPKDRIYNLGKEVTKKYTHTHKIKKKFIDMVEAGELYIHNFEYITEGLTGFTQIDLNNVFEKEFEVGNIKYNIPNNIEEAVELTITLLRTISKEQYYAQGLPAFDYFFEQILIKTFKEEFAENLRRNLELLEVLAFLPINSIKREIDKIESIDIDINIFDQYLRESNTIKDIFVKTYNFTKNSLINRTKKAIEKLINGINLIILENHTMKYSINTGTNLSKEGILLNEILVEVIENTDLNINFEIVFKVKKKVNLEENTSLNNVLKRYLEMTNNTNKKIYFSLLDSKVNYRKEIEDFSNERRYIKEVSYLNKFRILENSIDDKRESSVSRGNLGNVTINLASIGLKEVQNGNTYNLAKILRKIDEVLNAAKQILLDRFEEQTIQKKSSFPVLLKQEIWMESDKIKEEDKLRRALKHGVFGISFVGLFEMLTLYGKSKGKATLTQVNKIENSIITHISKRLKEFSEETTLNFELVSLDEETEEGMFIDNDLAIFGNIKNVTDKGKYTDTYKIEDSILNKIKFEDKMKWEGSFNKFFKGGHLFKVTQNDLTEVVLENSKDKTDKKILVLKQATSYNIGLILFV